MLPASPSFEQIALNRVTFGATDTDVAYVQKIGWNAWVSTQLAAPPGDDPQLAAFIASQTMPIKYGAANNNRGTWTAVDEIRPLNYLNASIATLWHISQEAEKSISPAERVRALQEVLAATWIRNVHSQWQLREFMTDFWHNHFNIGKTPNKPADAPLVAYDRDTIRPNVFGNFRTLLEADATSTSMMLYLSNASSTADTPNENYGRELLELHTMSADAYLGINPLFGDNNGAGYTDVDVLQASRALSGWTLATGQGAGNHVHLDDTGAFVYNPAQHNTTAGLFLGVDLSTLSGQAQGEKVLDLAAYHPSTATFVCTKLCRRIFADSPPQTVIDRAVAAWNSAQTAPNQIAQVLTAILTGGPEIGTWGRVKLRRPYERIMAMLRTTDMVVNASPDALTAFDPVNDALFAWATPDGRPDVNSYWLSTGATVTAWNLTQTVPNWPTITTSLASQTPAAALTSPMQLIEYWVGRMIGFALADSTTTALLVDQIGPAGVAAAAASGSASTVEIALRRLVALIAATNEFSYR